jgi:hypothetical protein
MEREMFFEEKLAAVKRNRNLIGARKGFLESIPREKSSSRRRNKCAS